MLVVHCKRAPFDVYIGRPSKPVPHHYGNPFSSRAGTAAAIVVADPVATFAAWLEGAAFQSLEQERRRWILAQLPDLAGKVLGCWCVTPENPQADCHGHILASWASKAAHLRAEGRASYTPLERPISGRDAEGRHMIVTLGDPRRALEAAKRLQEIRWMTGR